MADRKLISCIGYSLRLAKRHNHEVAVSHLSQGLYSLAQGGACSVKQISLYSALGFDEATADDEPRDDTAFGNHLLLFGAGTQVYDKSTQTESQMMTMEEFQQIIARIEKDLVEKLTTHLQLDRGPAGLDEERNVLQHPVVVCQQSFVAKERRCDHAAAGKAVPAVPAPSLPCFSNGRDETKHQRREKRKRELERMAGCT